MARQLGQPVERERERERPVSELSDAPCGRQNVAKNAAERPTFLHFFPGIPFFCCWSWPPWPRISRTVLQVQRVLHSRSRFRVFQVQRVLRSRRSVHRPSYEFDASSNRHAGFASFTFNASYSRDAAFRWIESDSVAAFRIDFWRTLRYESNSVVCCFVLFFFVFFYRF